MSTARRPQTGILFLTVFLDLVGFSLVIPLFPAMLEHYVARESATGTFASLVGALRSAAGPGAAAGSGTGIQVAALFGGVIGSLFSLLQFLFAPFWGGLSDRVGRRPVLLLTIGALVGSYLLWIFSRSFLLFAASRALGGIMSANISVATAAMADSTGTRDRAKGMGMLGAAFGLGFILGPALGGALSALSGMETGADASAAPAGQGAAAAQGAFGLHPFSAIAAAACVLSVVNFLVVALRFEETLRPGAPSGAGGQSEAGGRTASLRRLFRRVESPGVNRTNWMWFIYLTAFSGMEFTLTFLAADRFRYGTRQIAYLFVFAGLILVFVQGGLVRRIAPIYGERRLAVGGLLAVLPGFVLVALATGEGALYLALGLMALGSGLLHPALTALASIYAGPDRHGYVLGLFRSFGALARAVGPVVASLAYWRFGSELPYLAAAAVLLVPLGLGLRLPAPRLEGEPPGERTRSDVEST